MTSPDPTSLSALGWNAHFDAQRQRLAPDHVPCRVASEHRGAAYDLLSARGELRARLAGRLRHGARSRLDLPAVGDWVGARIAGDGAIVDVVLSRLSCFTRQAAGTRVEAQVVAANVDTVLVVMSLDQDFNIARLERYLAVVAGSGALPAVVLSKADLCPDPAPLVARVREHAPDAPVLVTSATDGRGLDRLRASVRPGQTAVLVGSSGVGKSTLVNALLGHDAQPTGAVREHDGRGRHVTTGRELFPLPSGGLLLDTPGMRELAAWVGDGDATAAGFDDIDALAADCRFRDCGHEKEPGCAVHAAIAQRRLPADRLESWRKLRREAAYLERKHDVHARLAEQKRWKAIHVAQRVRARIER